MAPSSFQWNNTNIWSVAQTTTFRTKFFFTHDSGMRQKYSQKEEKAQKGENSLISYTFVLGWKTENGGILPRGKNLILMTVDTTCTIACTIAWKMHTYVLCVHFVLFLKSHRLLVAVHEHDSL